MNPKQIHNFCFDSEMEQRSGFPCPVWIQSTTYIILENKKDHAENLRLIMLQQKVTKNVMKLLKPKNKGKIRGTGNGGV